MVERIISISVCVIVVVGVVIVLIPIVGKVYDLLAKRAARRYCDDNGLEFFVVKPFPNHYGLHFRSEGKKFYAAFDFEGSCTITWKKGTPLEVIERKATERAGNKGPQ